MGHGPKSGDTWYVDGSGTSVGVGAGMWRSRGGASGTFTLNSHNTVFQAETLAIGKCAEYLQEEEVHGVNINICSDSQAAIKALQEPVTKSKLVYRVKDSLSRISIRNKVTLFWIPGHQGYKGNEKADQIAKNGAAGRGLNVEHEVGIPYCSGIGNLIDKFRRIYANNWRYTDSCRWYKDIMGKDFQNWTSDIWLMSRPKARKLVAFLTGHYNMNCYLHKVGLSEDSLCRWCNEEEETPYHIICSCHRWAATRFKIYGKFTLETGEIKEGSLDDILRFCAIVGL